MQNLQLQVLKAMHTFYWWRDQDPVLPLPYAESAPRGMRTQVIRSDHSAGFKTGQGDLLRAVLGVQNLVRSTYDGWKLKSAEAMILLSPRRDEEIL